MAKRIVYISTIIILICFVAFFATRMVAKNGSSMHQAPIKVEVGDILFRSFSCSLANSKFYNLCGMPGHVAIVISDGEFVPGNYTFSAIKVVEARFFDHTQKQIRRQVGINRASENFSERCNGRRFLLKTHLNKSQKEKLVAFYKANLGKPYNLFAAKEDTHEFNCATFARQALIYSSGIDIDSDAGRIFFPNDIFGSPLFLEENNRICF